MANSRAVAAAVLYRQSDVYAALDSYREARQLFHSFGSRIGQGITWRGEADALSHVGDTEGALNAYRQAQRFFEAVDSRLGQGDATVGEADILVQWGNNFEALRAYRKARALFDEAGVIIAKGNAWRGEAYVLFQMGEDERALEAYHEARELYLKTDDLMGQANTWNGEAAILSMSGDYNNSLVAHRRARNLFEAARSIKGQASSWVGEATALHNLGHNNDALKAYDHARRLFEDIKDPIGQVGAWIGKAEVLITHGKQDEAAKAAMHAAEMARSQGVVENEILALWLEGLARSELAQWKRVEAVSRRAIDLIDHWREGFVTDTQRTRQENEMYAIHALLVSALWRLNQPLAALESAEQARSRVLLDLVATGHATRSLKARVPLDLLQQREELASDLAVISRELSAETSPEVRYDLLGKRREYDTALEQLHFESLLAANSLLGIKEPLDLAGMRAVIDEIGPTLFYYVATGEIIVYFLREEAEPVGERLDISAGELRQKIRRLAEALANPNYDYGAEDLQKELWFTLLGPVAHLVPNQGPLNLALHGLLHQVPFEALISPQGQHLFETFDITVIPSISTMRHVRERHLAASPNDSFFAFASGEGLILPVTEIRKIVGFFDPAEAAEFEATLARYHTYESLAPRARHVLIATQGTHVPGDRRMTYLEIQPSDSHDHRLTAAEIATIPIDAELVTLAACDTAAAEALLSDERLDLTRAFLIAGASAVLATRWRVPEDYRTSRFLVDLLLPSLPSRRRGQTRDAQGPGPHRGASVVAGARGSGAGLGGVGAGWVGDAR